MHLVLDKDFPKQHFLESKKVCFLRKKEINFYFTYQSINQFQTFLYLSFQYNHPSIYRVNKQRCSQVPFGYYLTNKIVM